MTECVFRLLIKLKLEQTKLRQLVQERTNKQTNKVENQRKERRNDDDENDIQER